MGWKVISALFFGKIPEGMHALDQADGPPKVYVFRDWQGAVASAAAGEHVIQAFGSVQGLKDYFGGYSTYGRLFHSNEFLGVWGHRNASRFRRILREKLGEIEVVESEPPARRSGASVTGRRLSRTERQEMEKSLRTND